MSYHGQGPIAVLSCRRCGRALIERAPGTDETTVHGDLDEAPDKANPLHEVNRYRVTCAKCGAVSEYDGPHPAADRGGPSAETTAGIAVGIAVGLARDLVGTDDPDAVYAEALALVLDAGAAAGDE